MKFKVGDMVRMKREVIERKLREECTIRYTIVSGWEVGDIDPTTNMVLVDYIWYNVENLELVPEEPEFKFGEEIEVRDAIHQDWEKRIFVGKISGNASRPYICVNAGQTDSFHSGLKYDTVQWQQARKIRPELTRKEIAEKFGVREDFTLVD